jgi:hypothetical protein
MTHAVLLGAGFSRNWGGWLATEVIGELLGRLANEQQTYALLRRDRNFEDTLAQCQAEARGSQQARQRLERLENAIVETFGEMNSVFSRLPSLEFSPHVDCSIQAFLARFDIIFSLNQDLLLELHYRNELVGHRRWAGVTFPGMVPPPNWHQMPAAERVPLNWRPEGDVQIDNNCQPVLKLHGSTNWREPNGNHLIVMGGDKPGAIERHRVLSQYFQMFRDTLCAGDTKLMVIGYSFRDEHVNEVLVDAGRDHRLQMYLVNPAGLDVLNPYPPGAIQGPNPLNDIPIVGISTRPVAATFASDELQRRSLYRFLQ